MMIKSFQNREFLFQVFALLLAFIVVHALYVALIRPSADAFIEQQRANAQADPEYVQQQNMMVIVKDYEQEACFVLMLWALAILAFKGWNNRKQHIALAHDLVQMPADVPIRPDDGRAILRQLETLVVGMRDSLLPRAMLTALYRFDATGNVQDASAAAHEVCDSEAEYLESELSIIRYIAWAIPSVGFIGTVRGIGNALGQAHRAIEGDISGVTENLGVAFNSTFVALVISIILMFFIHQLQLSQERLVLHTGRYLDQRLIRRLKPE